MKDMKKSYNAPCIKTKAMDADNILAASDPGVVDGKGDGTQLGKEFVPHVNTVPSQKSVWDEDETEE